MAFIRNHIGELERWQIGLQVEQNQGVWGFVTQEAQERGVSRWFIYWCHQQVVGWLLWWQLCGAGLLQRLPWIRSPEEAMIRQYLECESSLSGIARSLETLLGQSVSTGQISLVLKEYGSRLPSETLCDGRRLRWVADEL